MKERKKGRKKERKEEINKERKMYSKCIKTDLQKIREKTNVQT